LFFRFEFLWLLEARELFFRFVFRSLLELPESLETFGKSRLGWVLGGLFEKPRRSETSEPSKKTLFFWKVLRFQTYEVFKRSTYFAQKTQKAKQLHNLKPETP